MKIDVKINPQKIKILRTILSAQKPKIGCNKDAKICDILKITVAKAIEIDNFAAIKGIIGFNIPVYTSFTKWAPSSHNMGLYLEFGLFIPKIINQNIKKSIICPLFKNHNKKHHQSYNKTHYRNDLSNMKISNIHGTIKP